MFSLITAIVYLTATTAAQIYRGKKRKKAQPEPAVIAPNLKMWTASASVN